MHQDPAANSEKKTLSEQVPIQDGEKTFQNTGAQKPKNNLGKQALGFIVIILIALGGKFLVNQITNNSSEVNPQETVNNVSNYFSSSDWKEFNSADGGFRILFPDYPQREESDIKVPNSDITLKLIYYIDDKGADGAYLASFTQYPENTDVSQPKINLENALNGTMAANEGNKLISSTYSELQNNPALDFVIQNDSIKYTNKGKIVLVGKKIYQIAVVQGSDKLDDNSFNKFISSFQLTQ